MFPIVALTELLTKNDFDVFHNFEKSCKKLLNCFEKNKKSEIVKVYKGDARNLRPIEDNSIDGIITSPPYLNALEYMRGHKLSLVWLGYSIGDLSLIRSCSVGSEKGPDDEKDVDIAKIITRKMSFISIMDDPRSPECSSQLKKFPLFALVRARGGRLLS